MMLSEQEKFSDIVAMIQSAIRHSLAQPWMYEALGLAMMASDAPQSEVERALMSAVDMTNSQDEAMEVAVYMARVGLDRRALQLFRELAYANPFRPEPYAMGLACAKRLDDVEGIRWATLGILGQAWPEDQSGIEDRALRLAKATVEQLRQANRADEADAYEKAIEDARLRDVTVKVTWTGDADVDLMVEEPAGTVCSSAHPAHDRRWRDAGRRVRGGPEYRRLHRDLRLPKGLQRKVPHARASRVGKSDGGQGDRRYSDAQHRSSAYPPADSARRKGRRGDVRRGQWSPDRASVAATDCPAPAAASPGGSSVPVAAIKSL